MLTIAVNKGRLLQPALEFLSQAGYRLETGADRELMLTDQDRQVRLLKLRSRDVLTYVERGVAAAGIVGKNTLVEHPAGVLEVAAPAFGFCYAALAAPRDHFGEEDLEPASGKEHQRVRPEVAADYIGQLPEPVRIASGLPRTARAWAKQEGLRLELIELSGSIELAPAVGLAQAIIDLVSSGRTLAANNLVEVRQLLQVSARLVVNPVAYRLQPGVFQPLIQASQAQAGERRAAVQS